jgi:hypothetical protein
MARIPKTNVRKKTTKNIDKQRVVEIMRANINPKTNNPNYSRVSNLTGFDRKTLASWWGKRMNLRVLIPTVLKFLRRPKLK